MPKLVLILLERPSRLTETQLDKLSDILINTGTLFFGALVVPSFIPGIDRPLFQDVSIRARNQFHLLVISSFDCKEDKIMNFNQTDIGLLLFYIAGGIWTLIVLLIALPTLYKGPRGSESKK